MLILTHRTRLGLPAVLAFLAAVPGCGLDESEADESGLTAAATPVALVEGEALALPASQGKNVSSPGASGGAAKLIWSNGAATGSVTLAAAADGLTIWARGDQCKGAPAMQVAIDGRIVLSASVASTTFAAYAVPVSLAAATHSVSVAFTNDYARSTCDRNLYVDSLTFTTASTTTPPAPTPDPAPTPPPPGEGGTVLFDADLANRGLGAYAAVVSPQAISIIDDPLLGSARKAMRFTVNDGDTGGLTSNPRAQVETPRQFTEGQEVWVGWSMMFPTGWPQMLPDSSAWLTLAEFYGPPYAGAAPVSFGMVGSPKSGLTYMSHENGTNWRYAWNQPVIQTQRWYDMVVHEKFSTDMTVGFVEIFVNTGSGWVQQMIHGQLRYYTKTLDTSNGGGANYHKLALYRRVGMYPQLTVYFAAHKIATTFAAAAPHTYE
ncbi:MAG: heparin lyase I family protein [Deltaproteobacteria bacterium]|nr:heparin lyase I family protein [Deltaproteobacteria bacterium]